MKKVGIIGGAGYAAGELLRLLCFHPEVEISFVQSTSQLGKKISDLHPDLSDWTDLRFVDGPTEKVDVIFLCTGHGKAEHWVNKLGDKAAKHLIDLSADYRLLRNERWTYGLTEYHRNEIKKAVNIANPGCFATAIQLGILPAVSEKNVSAEWHVHAITGSTGAGAGLSDATHFSWRYSNLSIYKPFEHQHLAEIKATFAEVNKKNVPPINFLPLRGNFTRGIYCSMYTDYEGTQNDALAMYQKYYAKDQFVSVTDSDIDLKQVVNTNFCKLSVKVIGGKLLVISCIDNLIKGAAGQAIQNMNLLMGFSEDAGLRLKAIGF